MTTAVKAENRPRSQLQARKSKTGEKVKNRRESQQQARKSTTGDKTKDRPQSQEEARKSTTGKKTLGQKTKSRTGDNRRNNYFVIAKAEDRCRAKNRHTYFGFNKTKN